MGIRQAERTGITTTPSTLLRYLMQLPAPATRAVRVLGVDDFAWKKRFTYGTILVDLERRKIIDLLADRESATVEAWLLKHPEIDIVSRDRGKEFAKAATLGAPQAQQVGDRWRIVVRKSARQKHQCLSWKRQQKSAHVRFQRQPHGSSARLSR